jgi:hypothetical protein
MHALAFIKALKTHLDADEQARMAAESSRKAAARNKRPGSTPVAPIRAGASAGAQQGAARTRGLQLMSTLGLTHAHLCKASIATLEVTQLWYSICICICSRQSTGRIHPLQS